MPAPRVGAHTFLFSQYGMNQAEQIDEVFDTVAAAGYQAIELHRPLLDAPDWKARLDAASKRTGLGIVGASNGQPLWDIARYDAIMAEMETHSNKLAQLREYGRIQCGLSCSGKRSAGRTAAENAQAIKVWTELGAMFRRKGVVLNYHTHGEPIEDVRHVVDNVPADLVALGPDLDWLRVGGIDPEAFLREHAAHITLLHIRDYHVGGERTEALGEGDVDYAHLGRVLAEIGFAGEFVVELAAPGRSRPTRPAVELLKQSREHIRSTIGW
ncbi:MAG: sugar phosphate isomerase/epimerase [Chloroflexi bacterium]|nr:sugar phosphate isomerase/epimerase [Chloroflexota bacterium]